MTHVSDALNELRNELFAARDNEIQEAQFVGSQYITDHNNAQAYKDLDKRVNALARAWDRMIAKLEKWHDEAAKIENSTDSFYGD